MTVVTTDKYYRNIKSGSFTRIQVTTSIILIFKKMGYIKIPNYYLLCVLTSPTGNYQKSKENNFVYSRRFTTYAICIYVNKCGALYLFLLYL